MRREWNGEKKNSNGAAAYVICRCVRLRISRMYNGIPPFSATCAAQYENAFFSFSHRPPHIGYRIIEKSENF